MVETIDIDLDRLTATAPLDWWVSLPALGWERIPEFTGRVDRHEREFDREGYFGVDSAQVADTTATTIIFIGDSNTFGFGAPTEESFVEVVGNLLPDVHAINLGA